MELTDRALMQINLGEMPGKPIELTNIEVYEHIFYISQTDSDLTQDKTRLFIDRLRRSLKKTETGTS